MNRIDKKFKEDQKLLSIYFSAGHPKLEDTLSILKKLQSSGVDMVEIGLPFSDPLADGPTIQKGIERALKNKVSLNDVLNLVIKFREKDKTTPIVLHEKYLYYL